MLLAPNAFKFSRENNENPQELMLVLLEVLLLYGVYGLRRLAPKACKFSRKNNKKLKN